MKVSHSAACLAMGLVVAGVASAQYKYVAPDGRVTYSDMPPPPGQKVIEQKRLGLAASPTANLPFDVAQAVSRFPVTLYTGNPCTPCEEARNYLRNRGVPFAEKTVTSPEDIAAFTAQSPDGTVPVLSVGSRKATGFAPGTWSGLLDDAGYPPTSKLPRDFQNVAATPLSPATRPAEQKIAESGNRPTQAIEQRGGASVPGAIPTPPAVQPQPDTPAIRF